MGKDVTLAIIKFSVVIMLIALVLFFMTDAHSAQFIAICLTMLFCTLVFVSGTAYLRAQNKEGPSKVYVAAAVIYLAVLAVCIGVKVFIIL